MNSQRHVQAETLLDYLHNELPGPAVASVKLHLSYCPICQQRHEEVLLSEANYEICGLANRRYRDPGRHIESQVFIDFWKGGIKDNARLEELSEHCLLCEDCRRKRRTAWLDCRSHFRKDLYVAATLVFLANVAKQLKNSRRWVKAIVLLLVASGLTTLGWRLFGPWPLKDAFSESPMVGAIPAVKLEGDGSSTKTASPAIKTPIETRTLKGNPEGAADVKGSRRSQLVRQQPTKEVGKLWEEIAQLQRITLREQTADEPYRGANTDSHTGQAPQTIVLSRLRETGIHIELPEASKEGRYLVSLHEPGKIDTALAADEAKSNDGEELVVSLNLKNLAPGGYVLLVETETAGGTHGFVGYFPVNVIAPGTKTAG